MIIGFIDPIQVYNEWKAEQLGSAKDNMQLSLNYINEAVSMMIKADLLTHQIVFFSIDNYKGKLPKFVKKIHQVLYNYGHNHSCNRTEIAEWIKYNYKASGCDLHINVSCPQCFQNPCNCTNGIINLTNYEARKEFPEITEYYRNSFLRADVVRSFDTPELQYTHDFFKIYPASNDMFGLKYHIGDCIRPTYNGHRIEDMIEYTVDPPVLRLNIKTGQVLVSCLTLPTTELGDLLVPDCEEAILAVRVYLDMKWAFNNYKASKGDQKARIFWNDMSRESKSTMDKAKKVVNAFDYPELVTILNNYWNKLTPNLRADAKLHKNLNDPFTFTHE